MTDHADLVVPTIHLNGTTKRALMEHLEKSCIAIDEAAKILISGSPHGRDYYPQGDDVIQKAMQQHAERYNRLKAVREELFAIWEKIDAQPGK